MGQRRGGIRDSLRRWRGLAAVCAIAITANTLAVGGSVLGLGGCAGDAPGDQTGDDGTGDGGTGGTPHPTNDAGDSGHVNHPVDAGHDGATSAKDSGPSETPAPVLTSIVPQQATVGSASTTVVVTGTDFVVRTVVQLNGAALATSFVSDTELRASIPAANLATVQTLHVTVGTAPPGGGASADLPFDVVNPVPSITTLAPTSVPLGSPATLLTVTGASFVTGAKVVLDGTDLTTTFGSATSLSATIPAAKLAASGSYAVTIVNPAPGGGTSTPIAFIVSNPTVVVSTVSPDTVNVNASATTIQLVGTGFVAASTVSFNGTSLTSTTADAQHVSATVPATSLTNAGDFPVVVTNPAPGGGVSAPVTFHVVYASPTATALAPSSVAVGTAPPTVTVTGAGFVAGKSQVAFDGTPAATTVIDATHLSATLTTQQVASAHTIAVTVVNPSPGGGASAPPLSFTVTNPAPVATSVAPSSVQEGAGDTVVTVTGASFVDGAGVAANGSIVMIGATQLATTYVSPTKLTATVPASMLTTAATLALTVVNPAPGGGTSAPLAFTVTNPGPTVSSVSPSSVILPAGDTSITVTGAGFINGNGVPANGSQVLVGASALPTSFVNATTLTAVIPAASLATAGTLSIAVINPLPGGGTSGAVFFSVNNPAPTLASVSPTTLPFGGASTPITLTGTGFVSGSVVKSNGATIASTTNNATQITATVPSSQLNALGALSITVTNASPGGGVSAAKAIQVGCDSTGVDYPLTALNAIDTITLNLTASSAPKASRIRSTTSASASCPGSADSAGNEPYRAYVVQNTLGQTATLSAWASCSSTDDAFLTFYAGGTVPTTQAQIEACTGVIAEGSDGTGGMTSSDTGGSTYCPGLTKQNGYGLSLAACGRAVVFIQAWSTNNSLYTPPTTLKLRIE